MTHKEDGVQAHSHVLSAFTSVAGCGCSNSVSLQRISVLLDEEGTRRDAN